MAPAQSGASSLPRGFRYDMLQTPEPCLNAAMESSEPSSPRPRLRVKRRVASGSLGAPTQQFLASVAAADMPIPSIEEPEPLDDELMHDATYPVTHTIGDLCDSNMFEHPTGRVISPPKTPAPGVAPSLSPQRYPDWSIDAVFSSSESSPECDSRPSTSRSTQTSASAFSSRFSLASEEPRCASPTKQELAEPFPSLSTQSSTLSEPATLAEAPRSAPKPRRALWTKAMIDHLWATYNLYLQDPKVTPFQTNKTGVPPLGVCVRVAREATRSWKGSKVHSHAVAPVHWPHTHATTRTQLRELCKRKAGASQARGALAMASTPAAPGRVPTRHRARRATPSVFGNDMSVSLALSTAESMQPHGPLAQLAATSPPSRSPASSPPPLPTFSFPAAPAPLEVSQQSVGGLPRLGSPFMARGYGSDPADNLDSVMFDNEPTPRNSGPRRGLQSPVKISHSRSKSAVHKAAPQKMRSRAATNDPRKCRRPSVSEIFSAEILAQMPKLERPPATPAPPQQQQQQQQQLQLPTAPINIPRHYHDDSDVPRTPSNVGGLFRPRALTTMNEQSPITNNNLAVAAAGSRQLRLGSPFMANPSFSFPGRSNHHHVAGPLEPGMPFEPTQPSEGEEVSPPRNVTNRLAYVDLRLRELRHGHRRRRSDSPY